MIVQYGLSGIIDAPTQTQPSSGSPNLFPTIKMALADLLSSGLAISLSFATTSRAVN